MCDAKFYRMSQRKLLVGEVFKPTGWMHVGPRIESLLEAQLPHGKISRSKAVFVSPNPEVSKMGLTYGQGYLHVVKPIGSVEKRDNNFIGELQKRHSTIDAIRAMADPRLQTLTDDQIAQKYGAGEASPEPNWEFLCSGAEVVEVDDALHVVRKPSRLTQTIIDITKKS